jgi:molybdenum cofactor biosynthesis protein B
MAAHPHATKHKAKGGPERHRKDAEAERTSFGAAVITVSSTRTPRTDESGALIAKLFGQGGHEVLFRAVVRDDVRQIQRALHKALATAGVDIIVTSGGTGMTPSDVTVEAVTPLFDKRADGWGDVFRAVSREEIGNAALLSRSVAGTVGGKWVVSIPGSTGAARTAMTKLLLPELPHMMYEAGR